MDDTAPINTQAPAARRLDPWKILACVSTVVSVATIATLVWTVNKVSDDDPTPTERMSAAAGVTTSMIQAPAPAPAPAAPVAQTAQAAVPASAPSAPVTPTSDAVAGDSSLQRFFPMQAAVPAPVGAPLPPAGQWPAPGGLPPVNFASLPTPNINVNPGFSIDAIIAAVSGTAGWLGGGSLNLLGDIIVADAMNNGGGPRPTDPLTAVAAPLTKLPPPQWPRELDVTKIPPPQWPRELDVTKIPPPHVHWDRLLPRF